MDNNKLIVLDLGFGTVLFRDAVSGVTFCCGKDSIQDKLDTRPGYDIVYSPTASILHRSCGESYYSLANILKEYAAKRKVTVYSAWPFNLLHPVGTQQVIEFINDDKVMLSQLTPSVLASMKFIELFDQSMNAKMFPLSLLSRAGKRDDMLTTLKLIIPKSVKIFAPRDQPKTVKAFFRVIRYLTDSRRSLQEVPEGRRAYLISRVDRITDMVEDVDFSLRNMGGIQSVSSDCVVGKTLIKTTLSCWSLSLSFAHSCCQLLDAAAKNASVNSAFELDSDDRKQEIVSLLRLVTSEWAANTISTELTDEEAINGLTEKYRREFFQG